MDAFTAKKTALSVNIIILRVIQAKLKVFSLLYFISRPLCRCGGGKKMTFYARAAELLLVTEEVLSVIKTQSSAALRIR